MCVRVCVCVCERECTCVALCVYAGGSLVLTEGTRKFMVISNGFSLLRFGLKFHKRRIRENTTLL